MKKTVSLFLALIMLLSTLSGLQLTAMADVKIPCGTGTYYTYDAKTGAVFIDGDGDVSAYYFKNRVDIKSVTISDTVNSVGTEAFYGCTNITDITIGSATISDSAFYGCTSLVSLSFSASVKIIGASAFAKTGIKEVTIPKSVTEIRTASFKGCASLKTVTIDGCDKVEAESFSSCVSLETVTINEGTTTVEGTAFSDDTSLTEVDMPASVTTVTESDKFCDNTTANILIIYAGSYSQWKAVDAEGNISNDCLVLTTGGFCGAKAEYYVASAQFKSLTVTPKKIKAGKKSLTFSWNNTYSSYVGFQGYQVRYSTNKKFKKSVKYKTTNIKTSSVKIKKLKAKKKYYVSVRSFVVVNGKKHYTSWSKTKSVKVKK